MGALGFVAEAGGYSPDGVGLAGCVQDGDGRSLVCGDQVQVAGVVVTRLATGRAVGAWGAYAGSPVGDRIFECLQSLALTLHRGRDVPVLITGDVVKRGNGRVCGVVAAGHAGVALGVSRCTW